MKTKTTINVWIALALLVLSACNTAPITVTRYLDWQTVNQGVQVMNLTGSSTAPDASVLLTFPDTVDGLKAVQMAEPGTFVYAEQTGNYLLGWPQGINYGMVELTADGFFARHLGDLFRGQCCNVYTVTDALQETPGKFVTLEDVPPDALSALDGLLIWAQSALESIIPVIIVLPATNFQGYVQG